MKKVSEYSQKLRDPRWQKKRLEIMQRDNFTCQVCNDSKSTLNVHHCYYEKGADPWEYENGSLITLCESCHDEEANALQEKIYLTNELSKKGVLAAGMSDLMIAIHENPKERFDEYDVTALAYALSRPEIIYMLFQMYLDDLKAKKGTKNVQN